MKAQQVKWTKLRVGDLFRSRDDAYPLRVLALLPSGVLVVQHGRPVRVIFRAGVQVLRFTGSLKEG